MMRFTSRDPVRGKFTEPMSLHKYLYCWNEPINRVDLDGKSFVTIASGAAFGALYGGMGGLVGGFLEIFSSMAADPDYFTNMSQDDFDGFAANVLFSSVAIGALSGTVSGGIGAATGGAYGAMLGGYGAFAGNVGYNFIEGFCFNAGSRLLDKMYNFTSNLKGGYGIPKVTGLTVIHAVQVNSLADSIANGTW
jgi:hypothetical protein